MLDRLGRRVQEQVEEMTLGVPTEIVYGGGKMLDNLDSVLPLLADEPLIMGGETPKTLMVWDEAATDPIRDDATKIVGWTSKLVKVTCAANPSSTFSQEVWRDMADWVRDPLAFIETFWPAVTLYREQVQIVESVRDNVQTFVPAGNMLGKDFVAGLVVLWFFLTRHPVRIVTTSAKDDHLRVLWGEIGRFIDSSTHPANRRVKGVLNAEHGGPLVVTHHCLKKLLKTEERDAKGRKIKEECAISYVIGMVASPDRVAAMQGHHATPEGIEEANDGIPRTLFIPDESSSVPDSYWTMARTWFKRALVIGNTWPCSNFFHRAIKGDPDPKMNDLGGDILRDEQDPSQGYVRKIIKITAEDSPNVRFGMAERRAGKAPSNRVLIPGVKSYQEYVENLKTWDEIQISVSLKAEFWEGVENLLYPPQWLNHANDLAEGLRGSLRRAKCIGVDTGEGVADTALCAVDEYGVIELVAVKTPNTALIPGLIIEFARRHGLEGSPELWLLDRGGGGHQAADNIEMLANGKYRGVRTVGFGETLTAELKRGMRLLEEKVEHSEERYAYKNRRAQMYGELSLLLDPDGMMLPQRKGWAAGPGGFAIPREYSELRRQLCKIPRWRDEEGRLYLPPKQRKGHKQNQVGKEEVTMDSLIGCSPDQADALVLAVHGLLHKKHRAKAGTV